MAVFQMDTLDPQYSIESVGKVLLEKRTARRLSVHELAEHAGISAGMISQIERGLANPSIKTLAKLAAALGMQLGIFFEQSPDDNIIVHKNQRRKLLAQDPDFVYELLTPDLDHTLEMVWVESAPGTSTEEYPFTHTGEECGLILQGTLEIHIGNNCYILKAGDSIIFNSGITHWYHNPGPERVLSVWAITPPSF